jgi:cytochrome c oxidase subunit 2
MKRELSAILVCALLSGCTGWQSALDPQSAEASHLANLFWFFLAVCALVWLLVAGSLAFILVRRSARAADMPPAEDSAAQFHRKTTIVGGLTLLTAAILAVLTFASYYTTRGFTWPNEHTLTIKITGQQWWWGVQYQNQDPSQVFITANEIHIPVGRPVTFDLEASDVIHSFWVPNLMGKQDMIPGRKNYLTLKADRPGLYRGQCAEFCGLEHAKMAILVFAQPQQEFEAWRRQQIKLAEIPGAPQRIKGMHLFLDGPCAACHTVSGTDAGGKTGPDLTHFGSRATIAAGLLRNTPENLDRWLADPQALKPGNNMPQIPLASADRAALVAYVEGLK